jgi:outer membrane protein W
MSFVRIVMGCLVACLAFGGCVLGDDTGWTLRFHGALVDTSSQSSVSTGTGGTRVSLGGGGGFGLGAEYRFSRRVGLEMSTLLAGVDFEASVGVGSKSVTQQLSMSMVPLTLAVPIHFRAGKRADFWVAPSISRVAFMDFEVRIGIGGVNAGWNDDSDIALGLGVGIDVPLGKKGRWAFSSSLRGMKTEVRGDDVDPLIMTIGAAYRF